MEKIEKIKEIVEKNKGILHIKDLEKYNIHRQYVKELEEKEYLRKVARGLYVKKIKKLMNFLLWGKGTNLEYIHTIQHYIFTI